MKIQFSRSSRKYLKSIQNRIAGRILDSIEKLPEGDVKRIKGKKTPPLFRLRVGKYRIIYKKQDNFIQVIKIDTRGDVYKKQ